MDTRDCRFVFSDTTARCVSNRRVCIIEGVCVNKHEIINAIYRCIEPQFDAGHNWDALYDVLCSMEWIREAEVVLHHKAVPTLGDQELIMYLKVLGDSIQHWSSDGRHVLTVVFPVAARDQILRTLSSQPS